MKKLMLCILCTPTSDQNGPFLLERRHFLRLHSQSEQFSSHVHTYKNSPYEGNHDILYDTYDINRKKEEIVSWNNYSALQNTLPIFWAAVVTLHLVNRCLLFRLARLIENYHVLRNSSFFLLFLLNANNFFVFSPLTKSR